MKMKHSSSAKNKPIPPPESLFSPSGSEPAFSWKDAFWALAPGILCAIAILYPFFLSSGEFLYLDWNGVSGDMRGFGIFLQSISANGLAARWLPLVLIEYMFAFFLGPAASAIFPKFFFLGLFAAASAGLYLLFRRYPKPIYLFSVAILCFSPFAYERILVGQWGVVSALFLAPLILYFAHQMVLVPSRKNAALAALALSLGSAFLLQGLVLDAALLALLFTLSWWRADPKARAALPSAFFWFSAAFLVFNFFWLVPFALSPQGLNPSGAQFSSVDVFMPQQNTGMNTLFKSAAQYGFWREAPMLLGLQSLPFPFVVSVLLLLIGLSLFALIDEGSPLRLTLAAGWLAGVFLSAGLSHPWSAPLFQALLALPLFSGFRDSNKFVQLVALAYALLAPLGLYALMRARRLIGPAALLLALLATVALIAYNSPALGLSGQLAPIHTPDEYRTMADTVPAGERALYLPASVYQTYNWSFAAGFDGREPNQASRFGFRTIIMLFAPPFDYASNPPFEARLYDCVNQHNASCIQQQGVNRVVLDRCALASLDYAWVGANRTPYLTNGCLLWYHLGTPAN